MLDVTAFGGEALGRCLCHEAGALMNGVVPYERDTGEMALCELEHELSSDIGSIGAFVFDFPTSRTVRNKSLLFISHQVSAILL